MTVIVASKPESTNAEVIRAIVSLSTDTLNFNDTRNLPILYVLLTKGVLPVKKATVKAFIQGPDGLQTCEINPRDNGVGKY